MKKIKNSIAVLCSLLLFSCGKEAAKPGAYVIKISTHGDNNLCVYYLNPKNSTSLRLFSVQGGWFVDTCGRFNVGDVIKYTK